MADGQGKEDQVNIFLNILSFIMVFDLYNTDIYQYWVE